MFYEATKKNVAQKSHLYTVYMCVGNNFLWIYLFKLRLVREID